MGNNMENDTGKSTDTDYTDQLQGEQYRQDHRFRLDWAIIGRIVQARVQIQTRLGSYRENSIGKIIDSD